MKRREELPECPVATTVALVGSKWKLLILRNLMKREWRFNELQKSLEGISQKVLTDSLRQLEADHIIYRKDYKTNPPRVAYGLTELGMHLQTILDNMAEFGKFYKEEIRARYGFLWRDNIRRYYTYNTKLLSEIHCDWSYSAKDLEKELKEHFENQRITGVFVNQGFVGHELFNNYVNMCFENALSIIAFEKVVLILFIHAEGMIRYAKIGVDELALTEHNVCPGEKEKFLINIMDCDVDIDYENKTVKSILVEPTDETYPFKIDGYDYDRAKMEERKNNLPKDVIMCMENGVKITFQGDDMEYFSILVEKLAE